MPAGVMQTQLPTSIRVFADSAYNWPVKRHTLNLSHSLQLADVKMLTNLFSQTLQWMASWLVRSTTNRWPDNDPYPLAMVQLCLALILYLVKWCWSAKSANKKDFKEWIKIYRRLSTKHTATSITSFVFPYAKFCTWFLYNFREKQTRKRDMLWLYYRLTPIWRQQSKVKQLRNSIFK